MLIPAIDLKDGAVVQLIQGERLAIRDTDIYKWVARFSSSLSPVEDMSWR